MRPAIEISDNLDWTAIATFALAGITVVSLLFGWRSLRQGQAEVEEAHRPVVVPIADHRPMNIVSRPNDVRAFPYISEIRALVVPMENIGSGPALDVSASVSPVGDAGKFWPGAVAGISVRSTVAVEIRGAALTEVPDFALAITYQDVAGKEWKTLATYFVTDERYAQLAIFPRRPRKRS